MKNWFRDYGPMLLRNGYRIVAVDGHKRPIDKGWQEQVITHRDCMERDTPCGIGIQTGTGRVPVYAFDVDVNDAEVTKEFAEALGTTAIAIRIGGAPRFAVFFRMQEEGLPSLAESRNTYYRGTEKIGVGVRGDRQQMVAYGTHHIENKGTSEEIEVPYAWPNGDLGAEPLYLPVEELPLLTVEQRDAHLEEFGRIAKKYGYVGDRNLRAASSESLGGIGIDENIETGRAPNIPFERAHEILRGSGLMPDDYDTWVKVGMALATTYDKSDDAFELWNEWSSQSAKYEGPADLMKHWRSFRTTGENLVTMTWVASRYFLYHGDYSRDSAVRCMAERVKVSLRDVLRKSDTGKHWWWFDGGHWKQISAEAAEGKIARVLEFEYRHAIWYAPEGDEDAKEKASKAYAAYLRNPGWHVDSVRKVYIRGDDGTLIDDSEFDKSLRYIGVKNGDIDLETLELIAPNPERRISKVVDVEYDPTADCPTWRRVVQDCLSDKLKGTDGREEYEYFQRLVGYALTGSMGEDVIALLWGGGSNGKTLIMGTLLEVLNSYATQMQTSTLVSAVERSVSGAAARPDIMALKGSRLAMCEELPDNGVLDSATAKMLASRSTIAARGLFKDVVTFKTSATVIIGTNYLPRLTETGNGIVRRLRVFHFPNKYEVDARLPAQLEKEKVGIFNWILEGLRKYRAIGLGGETASMQEAKANWIKDEDCVGTWAEERLEVAEGHKLRISEITADYKAWARTHSAPSKTSRSIRENLEARGFRTETNIQRCRWLIGYKLKEFEEWT